jgi:hypothetical protein
MSKDKEIHELFARHNVPLDRDDVWAVQGTPVVKHKAVERLGAALGISWEPPVIIRSERDEAVLLVYGSTGPSDQLGGRRSEWSTGEALVQPMKDTGRKNANGKPIYEPEGIGNYAVTPRQAAYPYAMAEKRGKDRVILKLAGLQGVYSEEEADDFKSRDPEPSNGAQSHTNGVSHASKEIYVENSLERIAGFESSGELLTWAKTERQKVWPQYGIEPMDPDGQRIVKVYKARMAELGSPVGA